MQFSLASSLQKLPKSYSHPSRKPHFMSLVAEAELDGEAFNQCMQSGMARRVVAQDVQSAMRNRLDKTPTFIIEGQALVGGAPIETWRPMLDSLYSMKTGGAGN